MLAQITVMFGLVLCAFGHTVEKPKPLATDRGRVKVVKIANGFTLHTDQGSTLRGGATWIFKWGREGGATRYNKDSEYYRTMREHGLNAVRVIMFDPWQRSNNYMATDLKDPDDVKALVSELDAVVDLASKHGMYAVINYHDVGRYDKDYAARFWRIVAPRYRDRTHVVYELLNEPVAWFPEHYKAEHLGDIKDLYDLVRTHAPETHIVLLSFANIAGFDPEKSAVDVARRLGKVGDGIDWANSSVGYHPYVTGGTSDAILEMMAEFPVISTEGHFPKGVADVADSQRSQSMDGEFYQIQTHERLGIGWFQWQIEGPEKFQRNFVGKILEDANAKDYLWEADQARANPSPE